MTLPRVRDVLTIYGLVDPHNGVVRYVGCTGSTAEKRLSGHLAQATRLKGSFGKWIRSLRSMVKKPDIVILEIAIGEEEGAMAEWHWIYRMTMRGELLTNSKRTNYVQHLRYRGWHRRDLSRITGTDSS